MNSLKITNCLLSCLKSNQLEQKELLSQLDPIEWQELVTLAIQQKVEPWLYKRLKELDMLSNIPPKQLENLQMRCRKGTTRNLQISNQLSQVVKKFNQYNIPVIVLKGAYLAHAIYPSPSLRMMVDCDILVREEDLLKAVEALTQLGYQPDSPVELWNKSISHHLPPFRNKNSKLAFELHWTIIPPRHPRKIEINDFWERAQLYLVKGGKALTFCPEDLLLHICFHAAYSHLFMHGSRSLVDIAMLVEHFDSKGIQNNGKNGIDTQSAINWQTVCKQSQLWGCSKGVYSMLYLAKSLLNVNIPVNVLEALKPDNISNSVLETMKVCLFIPENDSIHDRLFDWKVMEGSLIKKIQFAFNRLFISHKEIANKYKIAESSLWVYYYYPHRLWVVLSIITQKVWDYQFKKGTFEYEINEHQRVSNWLKQT